MKKIAFCNAKGGVAKTTCCVNIGAGLARLNYKTLLIDLDTQGKVTQSLGLAPEKGLAELIEGETSLADAQIEARENLFVIAGGQDLAGIKRMIARREIRSEMVLAETLEQLNGFDYVLLDTAPSWDVLNVNCLFYTEAVAVPVSMEVLALRGIAAFIANIEQVQQYRKELKIKWIIPTFYDGRVKKSAEILEQLKKHFGKAVVEPIRYNVRISEAPGFGQHIFEYSAKSPGAHDYAQLIERIIS